jgi:hypothetical protein
MVTETAGPGAGARRSIAVGMTDWDRSGGAPAERERGTAVFLQVGAGILLVPLLHLAAGLVLWGLGLAISSLPVSGGSPTELLAGVGAFWLFGIGLGQLPYVVPVAIALSFVRRPLALGVVIGAALTLALNGACVGLLFGAGLLGGL